MEYTLTEDGRMAAWTFNAPDYPTEVFAGPPGAEGIRLTDLNPQLAEFKIARQEVITWEGPDGLEIEGVLTYPVDYVRGRRYRLYRIID